MALQSNGNNRLTGGTTIVDLGFSPMCTLLWRISDHAGVRYCRLVQDHCMAPLLREAEGKALGILCMNCLVMLSS